MPNPFRKTTTAVTSRGNPFRTSTADTAIRDSALSPLMEETPFTPGRPSLPVGGPRASRPLPTVVTTAEAPKELERRLARTMQAGTKRAEPFGGEGELTEAQRMQLERARGAVTVAEDIGKAVAGQPSRTLMRTATGIAQLRGDPRAQRLLEQTRALEAETAPQTGIGAVARIGSEIGAFIPSGLSMGAMRSGLESAAGEEFSTAGMLAQMTGREAPKSALGRALADAALDLSIPGAMAGVRGVRGVRQAGRDLDRALALGMREGFGEAAEAATPSLAQGPAIQPALASSTMRRLPARASMAIPAEAPPGALPPGEPRLAGPAIPAPAGMVPTEGPASPLMRLLTPQSEALRQRERMMPPAYGPFPLPEGAQTVRGPASSLTPLLPAQAESVRQRLFQMPPAFGPFPLPEGAQAIRGPVSNLTPLLPAEAQSVRQRLFMMPPVPGAKTPVAQALETGMQRAGQRAEEEAFDLSESRLQEVLGEEAPVIGGEVPDFLREVPVDQVIREIDRLSGAKATLESRTPSGKLRDIKKVRTDALLDELERQMHQITIDTPKTIPSFVETNWGGANEKVAHVTRRGGRVSMQAKALKRVENATRISNAIRQELETRLDPEDLYYEIDKRAAQRAEATEAIERQKTADFEAYLEEQTAARAAKQQPAATPPIPPGPLKDPGALMGMAPQERNALLEQMDDTQLRSVEQYAKEYLDDIFAKTGGPKPISEYKPAVQQQIRRGMGLLGSSGLVRETRTERSGFIAPQALGSIAGAGAGAVTGAVTDEEGGMSPLARALTYGAAGAVGGGALAGRLMTGKAPRAVPSIPELAPVAETINVGARQAAKEEPGLLSRAQRVRNQLVSETYVLEEAARQFGTPAQAKVIGGRIAQQQGSRQAAKGWLQDNLTPLIANLSDAEKESVRSLMKARRDLQIRQQTGAAKSAVDTPTLEAAVAAGNANPKIAQVADRITQMHRELLAKRHAAGLISDEAYEAIKASDDYYTPFFREMADEAKATGTLPGARGGRFSIASSGVRRMDRSAEALEQTADPLETIITDAARTYRDVSKQRVANVIFGIADEGNLPFIKRIQADPMNPPKGEGIIQQKRDGKLITYEVTDKDLFNALAGQDRVASNALVKFANVLKDVKTAGITALPDFAAANVIRDVAASGLQRPDAARAAREAAIGAGLGGGLGVATGDKDDSAVKRFLVGAGLGTGAGLYARPLLETMSAMKAIVRNEQIFRDFLADGASTEGFYVKDANDAAKALKQLEKDPRRLEEIVKSIVIPTNWWETLRKIGGVAEQSTRLAAYRQMKEAGFSAGDAALAAQDRTLRFANIGASPTVKNLAAMTPFWNAKVQGWDKLGRLLLAKGNRGKTAALGAGMLTAPTVALWSVNKDNPEYWERPAWEKNLFWLVPKSFIGEEGEKGFYRIPKPFELGFLFASLPERLLDYATQAGVDIPLIGEITSESPVVAEPGRGLARSAKDIAAATMEGTLPIPEVANVPLQVMVNRDLFRDQPIVKKPQLSPELQVTEESSTIARALAQAGVRPEMTDFVIRSTLGTAGSELSKAIDIGARAAGLNAPPPPAGSTRVPVLGRFEERFATSTKGQTDPEAMARERLRELNQVRTDLNELRRIGDRERLLDFVDKNLENVKLLEKIQPLETELEKISRLRTQVRKAPGLTPDQRQGALEILRERGQKVSETLIGVPSR